uniref:Uncharacterized protein n=1 Tax=Solanum tuberosum TaxID=4113 RepID=M1DQG1_SOLTU
MDFSDRDAPYPFLDIMENKQHSCAKVLTLKVHAPIIGTFPLVKKKLDTSHHLPEWSSTKTKDVTDNFSGNVTTEKVLLLKSFTHQNVVVAIPPRRDENLSSWLVPSSGFCLLSSFVTLRLDDELIVEPYSPHRFSQPFGYCQDVHGALIEHHYDGSLLSLVQLWDSCVHLGSSSKIIIPMGPSNKGSLMTLANEIQLTKPMVPFAEKVEISQNISTTNVEVVETSQIGCSDVSRDLVRPLLRIASNFEPQKTISSFKLSYISGMWRTLCECITQFSVESSENLKELEAGVALILKGLREVNIINLSPLEVLLEDFFKKHKDYDVARLSTSQKITRDSHQELLSAAQQCLDTANEERINMDK